MRQPTTYCVHTMAALSMFLPLATCSMMFAWSLKQMVVKYSTCQHLPSEPSRPSCVHLPAMPAPLTTVEGRIDRTLAEQHNSKLPGVSSWDRLHN